METDILERTLTDGSKTYAVAFVDGSLMAVMECEREQDAIRLQRELAELACYATIEHA